MCLACGELVCCAGFCCRAGGHGESARHAAACGRGAGLFFSRQIDEDVTPAGDDARVCIRPCTWTRTAKRMSFSNGGGRCFSARRGSPRSRNCGCSRRSTTTASRRKTADWEATRETRERERETRDERDERVRDERDDESERRRRSERNTSSTGFVRGGSSRAAFARLLYASRRAAGTTRNTRPVLLLNLRLVRLFLSLGSFSVFERCVRVRLGGDARAPPVRRGFDARVSFRS